MATVTDGYLTNPELLTWDPLTNVTPSEKTSGNTGISWTEDTGNLLSWELSFTLSVKSISDKSDEIFGTNGKSGGAYGYVLNVGSDGAIFLTNGRQGVNNALIATEAGAVQIGNGEGSFGEGVQVTLSFTNYVDETTDKNAGGYFTLTVGDYSGMSEVANNDNTSFIKGDGESRLWTNGGVQTFTDIAMSQGGNMIVPEPTTATLSLLALAALAARRRRR